MHKQMKTGCTLAVEEISPEKAEEYLAKNGNNRHLRDSVVERYTSDMVSGGWTQCVAPIVFYEDGALGDGQHRLQAVVESGTTQTFIVMRGVPHPAGLNIDTGLTRNVVDNGRISGANKNLSNSLIAAARAINDGFRVASGSSNAIKIAIVEKHYEAATFATKFGPKTKLLNKSVLSGAIGRAWYHEEDKEKLKRFCDVVDTGFSAGIHETAAVSCRNFLLAHGQVSTLTVNWRNTFLRMQNAIWYFMRGEALTVLKSVGDEAYGYDKMRVNNNNRRLHIDPKAKPQYKVIERVMIPRADKPGADRLRNAEKEIFIERAMP
tara:strand:+ start:88 stop:1050 length:963 start_codon:yes stop_codon:yes gene_type:complete